MLTVITGNLGSGKTLFLTILGTVSTKQVISNYNLGFPYKKFSMFDFAEGKYDNAIVLIDEAYSILESRNFMSSGNIALSYILFQSRKKSLDLVLTVQLNSTLDVRFRQLADIMITCVGLVKRKEEIYFKYILFPRGKIEKNLYLKLENAKKYFNLYDTNQIIQPIKRDKLLAEILNPKEKMKKVKEIAEIILQKYLGKKITRSTIKYELFKNQFPDSLKDYIFEEIRQKREKEKKEKKEMK